MKGVCSLVLAFFVLSPIGRIYTKGVIANAIAQRY